MISQRFIVFFAAFIFVSHIAVAQITVTPDGDVTTLEEEVGIGQNNPKTILHISQEDDPTIRLQDTDEPATYSELIDRNHYHMEINKHSKGFNNAWIDLNPYPGSFNQDGVIRLFPDVVTNGKVALNIFNGDATSLNHQLTGNGNSSLSRLSGNLAVGDVGPAIAKLHVFGDFQVRDILPSSNFSTENRIWVSGSDGALKYRTVSSLLSTITASEGLTKTGDDIALGGALTADATIETGSNSLILDQPIQTNTPFLVFDQVAPASNIINGISWTDNGVEMASIGADNNNLWLESSGTSYMKSPFIGLQGAVSVGVAGFQYDLPFANSGAGKIMITGAGGHVQFVDTTGLFGGGSDNFVTSATSGNDDITLTIPNQNDIVIEDLDNINISTFANDMQYLTPFTDNYLVGGSSSAGNLLLEMGSQIDVNINTSNLFTAGDGLTKTGSTFKIGGDINSTTTFDIKNNALLVLKEAAVDGSMPTIFLQSDDFTKGGFISSDPSYASHGNGLSILSFDDLDLNATQIYLASSNLEVKTKNPIRITNTNGGGSSYTIPSWAPDPGDILVADASGNLQFVDTTGLFGGGGSASPSIVGQSVKSGIDGVQNINSSTAWTKVTDWSATADWTDASFTWSNDAITVDEDCRIELKAHIYFSTTGQRAAPDMAIFKDGARIGSISTSYVRNSNSHNNGHLTIVEEFEAVAGNVFEIRTRRGSSNTAACIPVANTGYFSARVVSN